MCIHMYTHVYIIFSIFVLVGNKTKQKQCTYIIYTQIYTRALSAFTLHVCIFILLSCSVSFLFDKCMHVLYIWYVIYIYIYTHVIQSSFCWGEAYAYAMYIYIYMYIYTCILLSLIYTHINKHMYIYIHICIYIHSSVYDIYIYIYERMHMLYI